MLYKIIDYLSKNLYVSVVIVTVIALIVFFIIGSIKQKKEQEIIREKLNETKIDAPKTRKKFIQGEVIEKQVITINNENEE